MIGERRVVVTGLGAVSCLGTGVEALWDGLTAGKSGIGPITKFDPEGFRCTVAGEVSDFDITDYMPAKEARRLDGFCHYAIGAGDEATGMAQLTTDSVDPTRIGVLVGAGIGGISTLQKQCTILLGRGPTKSSPLTVPMMIVDMAAGALSIRYGFQGPNLCVVTACATGSHSIGEASWIIKRGDADVMLTGGTEACVCALGLTGFNAMRALSSGRNDDPTRASRPFDAGRDGFVPAEGAGILVLEEFEHARKRGVPILAEVVGYGLSGVAHHITAPDPEGLGAARAIRMAVDGVSLRAEDVGYVNAHGTSTQLNDRMETAALKQAFGDQAYNMPVSSTKSMIGHTLGAAGGLEAIIAIKALTEGILPPTINYETPDPDCDLDYIPNVARRADATVALSLNLGFGGHNAVLAFRKWDSSST